MEIPFNILNRQFEKYQNEYEAAALRVLRSGYYVLGEEVQSFEEEFASWNNEKYCVGVNSGLDALILAIRALGMGPGDEILVPANTYIASVLAITLNGATPVFVEPDEFYNMDPNDAKLKITSRTKAILVVHLYGQVANIGKILDIADTFGLFIVEDCAQAHGAVWNGKKVGTFGDIGCFSFFPTKNMGAYGDAGAIVTSDEALSDKVRTLRNYGSREKYYNVYEGINSRMDEIQAALLRVKLNHIEPLTDERRSIAKTYIDGIINQNILLPKIFDTIDGHVFHLFVVRVENREDFQGYMKKNGIHTQVHYPVPPHLAECYTYLKHSAGDFPIAEQYAGQVVSLPLYNGMTAGEIREVVCVINNYERLPGGENDQ